MNQENTLDVIDRLNGIEADIYKVLETASKAVDLVNHIAVSPEAPTLTELKGSSIEFIKLVNDVSARVRVESKRIKDHRPFNQSIYGAIKDDEINKEVASFIVDHLNETLSMVEEKMQSN